jgi:coatomer subunit beta'
MVSDGNFFRQTRVKAIDYHPTEPCMAVGMHSGRVTLYDENSGSLLQSIQATTDPVRCVKFVARKQWLLAGSDDKMIHVFHSQTLAKIVEFQAHDDYLRWIEIHPTLPCFLSASDDFTIKIWNWDRNFDCTHVFTGHSHYVMQVKINPIDTNTFASAALDWNVKLWSLSSSVAQHTLTGHERGVNSIEYFPPGEKPYIVSAADDCSIKVWNYQVTNFANMML